LGYDIRKVKGPWDRDIDQGKDHCNDLGNGPEYGRETTYCKDIDKRKGQWSRKRTGLGTRGSEKACDVDIN
jgi:hypothetical protein